MGNYLNPGNTALEISVNDDIYIDKSGIISFVNQRIGKRKRFLCVSRPRRFGKSMTAEMLVAYYDKNCNSQKLFQDLEIAKDSSYEIHLNHYNVIFLNIQQFLQDLFKDCIYVKIAYMTGILPVKKYGTHSVFIPNQEVSNEFIRALKNGSRPELVKAIQKSDEIEKYMKES